MKKRISLLVVIILLLLSAGVFAKSLVSISITAEKEVTVNKVKKMVVAKEINPGDVIHYTVSYINSGDEAATNAVLDDPIPQGTVYIPGTAFGKDTEIAFSIDGGKTFKKPSVLTYEVKLPNGKMEKKVASPEQYTHIRWIINTIPAGGKGQVGFQVRVK
jgi:uncharacterized repeat protein (TIGR01451 family)